MNNEKDGPFYTPLKLAITRIDCNATPDFSSRFWTLGGGAYKQTYGAQNNRPRAILFRQVATPNYELRSFLRICKRFNLNPVILEYHQDKFTCRNPFKRSLVHLPFIRMFNKLGKPVFFRKKIGAVESAEGSRIADISIDGQKLTSIHGDFFESALNGEKVCRFDGSEYFKKYATGAKEYYVDLFMNLQDDTILFEDFVTEDADEGRFFNAVVKPAFNEATIRLGKKPVVVRLCTNRRYSSPLWYAYPDKYCDFFMQRSLFK